jgi:hypothetical protein
MVLKGQANGRKDLGKVLEDLEGEKDPVEQKSIGWHQSTWERIDRAIERLKKRRPGKPVKLNKVTEKLVLYALGVDEASEEDTGTQKGGGKR